MLWLGDHRLQGLPALGYKYISLDDCWAKSRDPKTGVIIPDPKAFPDGAFPGVR